MEKMRNEGIMGFVNVTFLQSTFGAGKKHENLQSKQSVFRPRSEPGTSTSQARSVIAD
jgi:hypothetical protein